MNLAVRVLVGGVAGILAGLFFGDYCGVLRPVGFAYVMLLEAAVYPYLICSLLHGLGSLEPAKAWRLFTRGWAFYVAAWAITFAGLFVLALAIPPVSAPIMDDAAPGAGTSGLLTLLIPSDLFTALNRNYVPAVVVFCIFYGVAIQTVKDKAPFLSVLEAVRLASLRFWNWIVELAPLGIFALFAVTAGTTAFRDLVNLSVYLALFLLGAAVLAFVALPAFASALAPVGVREFVREMRAGLAIAALTTLSVAALPFVTEATRKFAQRNGIEDAERDDVIRTNLSVAYPLGQVGNFFVYFFVLFVAYYYKAPIHHAERLLLPGVTLLSGFGSPTSAVNAVTFLQQWLALPAATSELYVELQTITRYGQVVASVMAFGFLSLLVTFSYFGKLRVRPSRLVVALVVSAVAMAAVTWAGREAHGRLAGSLNLHRTFTLDPALTRGVTATVYKSAAEFEARAGAGAPDGGGTAIARIQRTGLLRVGYNASIVPFCDVNDAGQLVGYDVAQAYDLARSLNVRLAFIPFECRTWSATSWPSGSTSPCRGSTRRRSGSPGCPRRSPTSRAHSRSSCPSRAPGASPRASRSSPWTGSASACSTTPSCAPSSPASCPTPRSWSCPTTACCPTSRRSTRRSGRSSRRRASRASTPGSPRWCPRTSATRSSSPTSCLRILARW